MVHYMYTSLRNHVYSVLLLPSTYSNWSSVTCWPLTSKPGADLPSSLLDRASKQSKFTSEFTLSPENRLLATQYVHRSPFLLFLLLFICLPSPSGAAARQARRISIKHIGRKRKQTARYQFSCGRISAFEKKTALCSFFVACQPLVRVNLGLSPSWHSRLAG